MKRFIAIAATCFLLASPALAQEDSGSSDVERMQNYTDPSTATLISVLVAGGGHLYSGETGKGIGLLGVQLGGPILGAALSSSGSVSCTGTTCSSSGPNLVPLYLGSAAAVGAWVYGIIDADDAARRANERNGVTSAGLRMSPKVAVQNGETSYGMQLSMTF